jgi:hypothetical protein
MKRRTKIGQKHRKKEIKEYEETKQIHHVFHRDNLAQSVQCPTVGVRSPTEAKDFSSNLSVQTGSEAHPASSTVGTVGLFPGG